MALGLWGLPWEVALCTAVSSVLEGGISILSLLPTSPDVSLLHLMCLSPCLTWPCPLTESPDLAWPWDTRSAPCSGLQFTHCFVLGMTEQLTSAQIGRVFLVQGAFPGVWYQEGLQANSSGAAGTRNLSHWFTKSNWRPPGTAFGLRPGLEPTPTAHLSASGLLGHAHLADPQGPQQG